MSFSAQASRVRDLNRPIWYRLITLRECISLLSFHSEKKYQELVDHFDEKFHFNRNRPRTDPPTEQELLNALEAVIQERRKCLERLQDQQQSNLRRKLARKNAQRLASVRRFQEQNFGV